MCQTPHSLEMNQSTYTFAWKPIPAENKTNRRSSSEKLFYTVSFLSVNFNEVKLVLKIIFPVDAAFANESLSLWWNSSGFEGFTDRTNGKQIFFSWKFFYFFFSFWEELLVLVRLVAHSGFSSHTNRGIRKQRQMKIEMAQMANIRWFNFPSSLSTHTYTHIWHNSDACMIYPNDMCQINKVSKWLKSNW